MIDIDVWAIIKTFFSVAWSLLKAPLFIVACFVGLVVALIVVHFIIFYAKGMRLKKATVKPTYKKRSKIKRLFYDFPRRIALDMFNNNPNMFKAHGLIVFTGRQGRGKTIALVKQLLDFQAQYPQCNVMTNLAYVHEDKVMDHWRRLIDFNNGEAGVVCAIDETQNWFSSNQSKNFPPEMLSVVTQNRKNKRCILGTAQNFYLLAKAVRSQCTEVRECVTIARCLTIVRRREPIVDTSGEVVKFKNLGIYFFVHDDELRKSYDTYKVIENLKHSGFQERTNSTVSVTVNTE